MTARLKDPASRRVLELNRYPRKSMFSERYRKGSELDRLDVSVGSSSPATLERAYRRLLRNGGRSTRLSPTSSGGWAAVVKDPDGIRIRLGRSPTPAERRAGRRPGPRRRRKARP